MTMETNFYSIIKVRSRGYLFLIVSIFNDHSEKENALIPNKDT